MSAERIPHWLIMSLKMMSGVVPLCTFAVL